MPYASTYPWIKAPFIRLLVSLIVGIVIQWKFQLPLSLFVTGFVLSLVIAITYSILSITTKFKWQAINGLFLNLMLVCFGGLLVWLNDIRHQTDWVGKQYKQEDYIVVTLQETLAEKANSYKALASIDCIYEQENYKKAKGQVILYFKKDSSTLHLHYGSQILFKKTLQEIKNTGNPGSFDYKTYCLFQGITHQVFLSANDFTVLATEQKNNLYQFIYSCRDWIVATLQKQISGEKEQGLAEALMIGYKDDLDKTLVKAYSNTGVVHVIAISGLHLGLIYGLLLWFTYPLRRHKKLLWIRLLIILSGLWLFSLLAGAQPSVLRSAVMFSFIALGEVLSRRSSIINNLALSAFVLLCINPFWLWDVGFQLSYAAVTSIIIFFKPVYNWLSFPNKLINNIWKLMAVSIAAQVLTLPISVYYFHQLPLLFLFTNIVAVPLSSIILFGELLGCALFFIKPLAVFVGSIVQTMIRFMNLYIERLNNVSISTWQGLSITVTQTILLTVFITAFCYWLLQNKQFLLWCSAISLLSFIALRSISFIQCNQQSKLIVYNIPRHNAIDLIAGRTFTFIGDSDLLYDEAALNYTLQPSHTLFRTEPKQTIPANTKDFEFCNKTIIIIDSTLHFSSFIKQPIDLLILSKNPRIYISNLTNSFTIKQIVFDSSVPSWKAKIWKHDCDSLHIQYYDVSEQGAYVMDLNN